MVYTDVELPTIDPLLFILVHSRGVKQAYRNGMWQSTTLNSVSPLHQCRLALHYPQVVPEQRAVTAS